MSWVLRRVGGVGGGVWVVCTPPWCCCVYRFCGVPCFCTSRVAVGLWLFCVFLFVICPNCSLMQLFLVSYSFFVFCCSRNGGDICPGASTLVKISRSQVPGPSLSEIMTKCKNTRFWTKSKVLLVFTQASWDSWFTGSFGKIYALSLFLLNLFFCCRFCFEYLYCFLLYGFWDMFLSFLKIMSFFFTSYFFYFKFIF